jgi:hypothetical protein
LSFDITVVELSFMSYTSTGNRNMLQWTVNITV